MNKRKFEFSTELCRQMKIKPYSKISISDICDTLKCSRQSFYYYFGSIDESLSYYLKESFKNQIREEYLVSDVFNFFANNAEMVNICFADNDSKEIFWNAIQGYLKKQLDMVYARNFVEYLGLYAEQKEVITSFYVSGLLAEVKMFFKDHANPVLKEKYIAYCRVLIGTGDDTKQMIKRIVR